MMKHPNLIDQAEALVKTHGGRATRTRTMVLAFLLSQHKAMTHYQIEHTLGEQIKMDRVTLYRTLEWLTEKGLAHKFLSNQDRAWRFLVNDRPAHSHQHPHFACTQCDKVVCLDKIKSTYDIPLPEGYQMQGLEMTVKGLCVSCA
ncbi:MAG: transcriptional repressor [Pseudomonadota bacterium]